jgi:D-lactate dehydrogenase (cytochrome)
MSGQQTADVLKLANDNHIAVTPWGVGTGLEGNSIPLYGGILMSFERMNKLSKSMPMTSGDGGAPGIGHKDLNEKLARYGLFFAPDPGATRQLAGCWRTMLPEPHGEIR